MTFCAAPGSFQRLGSSDFALSSARRRVAASTSKMPPQQPERLLDRFEELFGFRAHGNSTYDVAARHTRDVNLFAVP
jgi:hypothetical protein